MSLYSTLTTYSYCSSRGFPVSLHLRKPSSSGMPVQLEADATFVREDDVISSNNEQQGAALSNTAYLIFPEIRESSNKSRFSFPYFTLVFHRRDVSPTLLDLTVSLGPSGASKAIKMDSKVVIRVAVVSE